MDIFILCIKLNCVLKIIQPQASHFKYYYRYVNFVYHTGNNNESQGIGIFILGNILFHNRYFLYVSIWYWKWSLVNYTAIPL